jgi:hypothetical protein
MGGIGGTIGGILGGAAGTAIAGPAGTTIGASLGTGLGQLIQGGVQKKKAKGMLPSPEDVGERALLNTLRRRQQALATGTAYNPQVVAGQQMAKAMQRNAFAAGGPVNQGMYAGLMSQTMGNIAQQTSQDIAQTLAQQGQLATQMANRKADLTLLQRNEMMADAAQNIKDSGQNLAAALQPQGEVKEGGAADLSGVASSLYSENETLKKKLKEIEEQKKKEAEATGITGGTTGG